MELLPLVLVSLALIAFLAGAMGVHRRYLDRLERLESAPPPQHELFNPSELERRIDVLTLAVSEGIDRVDRAERRVQATVRGAQRELAKSGLSYAPLEAEAAQLQLIDGGGGDEGEVPFVPDSVGEAQPSDVPSGVPGLTQFQLDQIRASRETA